MSYGPKVRMDLSTWDSGPTTLVCVMRALVETGSHFTDTMRLSTQWGRGISLFMRVQVPPEQVATLREKIGKRGELREPPKVQLNVESRAPVESGTVSGERFDWIDGHACVTGDCPHGREAECAETLRALCIEVAQSLKQAAPTVSPATPSVTVEEAYREGWHDGYRLGNDHGQTSFGPRTTGSAASDWEYSEAKKSLSLPRALGRENEKP